MKEENNKRKGTKFEEDFATFLSHNNYWVHLLAGASHTGSQPCDVIAIRYNIPEFYDCKTLENKNGLFPISRIEENQRLSYQKIRNCYNYNTFFGLSILWENDLYIVSFDDINFDKKSINLKEITPFIKDFYSNF